MELELSIVFIDVNLANFQDVSSYNKKVEKTILTFNNIERLLKFCIYIIIWNDAYSISF